MRFFQKSVTFERALNSESILKIIFFRLDLSNSLRELRFYRNKPKSVVFGFGSIALGIKSRTSAAGKRTTVL